MNLLNMARKNLLKNLSFYSLYLVSVAFVVTIYFSFASFSTNEIILEKISSDGRVETMCRTISVFLMVFVIFYLSYSNRFFLRRRTKELGIYALLGYRRAEILKLLTFENLFICCGASIAGIILGGAAHKGIVFGISSLLNLSVDSSKIPFWNLQAVIDTVLFLLIVGSVLVISNGIFLYQTSLMKLIRFEKSAEKTMKFHKLPAIAGFVMIAAGYALALDIIRGEASVWIKIGFYQMGLITMLLVVTGTVLFITSFLPYLMRQRKKQKRTFYSAKNIITTPNFIYRIRSNAKTLVMLTLLFAATLTVSSVMALTLYYPIAAVARIAPSEIEFRAENIEQREAVEQIVKNALPDAEDIIFTSVDLYKVKSSSNELPAEYSLGTAKQGAKEKNSVREPGFECMSFSAYAELLEAQGKAKISKNLTPLSEQECILMKYESDGRQDREAGKQFSLLIGDTEVPVTVREASLENVISFANSIGTLVVSDALYSRMSREMSPVTSVCSINGDAVKNQEALYDEISACLNESPYLQGNSHRINELVYLNSSTFLLIGFLVVLFFIAAGSILYFNNISAIIDSKADYDILQKIGYRKELIRKIVRKQIWTYFSIPFLLGILDCIFAALVYKTGLMQNILENSPVLYAPAALAIVLSGVIYLIYYIATVRSCYKILD